MELNETKHLIDAIKNDIIELLSIDYEQVSAELSDLDAEEKKELLILVGGGIIDILASVKLGPLAIVKMLGAFK
jgi:prefoldin subunit 5